MYYLKRCLLVIFIILLLLFFPTRRILRENGFFVFGDRTLKEALMWAREDSIRVADSLKKIKIESTVLEEVQQAYLVKSDKEEHPVSEGDIRDTYNIIVGSFSNPENSRLAAGKFRSLGYKTNIISKTNQNGIKTELVSVNTFISFDEAVRYLSEFKSKFNPSAWIYLNK
jgi:hypothetical protein